MLGIGEKIYRTQVTYTRNIFHIFYFWVHLTKGGIYAFPLWQPGDNMSICNMRVYIEI